MVVCAVLLFFFFVDMFIVYGLLFCDIYHFYHFMLQKLMEQAVIHTLMIIIVLM